MAEQTNSAQAEPMPKPTRAHRGRRLDARQVPKRGTKIACMKGAFGLGANIGLTIVDLSQTGVRLIVKTALERGQEMELSLLAPGISRPFKTVATVAWCVTAADGTYRVGAQFRRRMRYRDFRNFIPGA
jgi:hypothetical protein